MLCAFLVLSVTFQQTLCVRQYLDLSYWLEEGIPVYPLHHPYNMSIYTVKYGKDDNNIAQVENLIMSSHTGTHIDAPVHMIANTLTLDQIPREDLSGPGVVVDVQDRTTDDRNYAVTAEDIFRYEEEHGAIPPGAVVLFRTGWGKRWSNVTDYLGTAARNVSLLSFPGLSEEAAKLLVTHRDIVGVGLDTCSLDPGNSTDYPAHIILAKANKWGLENVANMDSLPAKGFDVYVFPLKLCGASGAPVTVAAFLQDP